jgi:WD40 repeat protein
VAVVAGLQGGGVSAWTIEPGPELLLGPGDVVFGPGGEPAGFLTVSGDDLVLSQAGGEPVLFRIPGAGKGRRAITPDGRLLAFEVQTQKDGKPHSSVHLWDLSAPQERQRLDTGPGQVVDLALSADGKRLACWIGNEVRVRDAVTGQQEQVVQVVTEGGQQWYHQSRLALSATPTGDFLAVGGRNARLWDLRTGQVRASLAKSGVGGTGHVIAFAFSPDGKTLAILNQPNLTTPTQQAELALWDLATMQECLSIPLKDQGRSVGFTPGGSGLLVSTETGYRLWQTSGPDRGLNFVHESPITAASFLPDGKGYVTAAREVYLWDAVTGRKQATLPGERFALARDGSVLATAGGQLGPAHIRLSDPQTGAERTVVEAAIKVGSVAVSPDGRWLAAAPPQLPGPDPGPKNIVQVWDARSGAPVAKFPVEAQAVGGLVFPSAKELLIACWPPGVARWDTTQAKLLEPLPGKLSLQLPMERGGDGRLLFDTEAGAMQVRDPETGTIRTVLHGLAPGAWALSQDGSTLAVPTPEGISVIDVATGRERTVLPQTLVSYLSLSPDGKSLIAKDHSRGTKWWDVATGQSYSLGGPGFPVVAFSPDGDRLLEAPYGVVARLWDLSVLKSRAARAAAEGLRPAAFSADGSLLAAAGADQRLTLRQVSTATVLRGLPARPGFLRAVAFRPDGKLLASSHGKQVRLWDTASGTEMAPLPDHPDLVHGLAFSPDGSRLATACQDGFVRLFSVEKGVELQHCGEDAAAVRCIAFSIDGKLVAAGQEDGLVKVWDAATGKERHSLAAHKRGVRAVAFAPDSEARDKSPRLASGCRDGQVVVWDLKTGKPAHTLQTAPVTALAFDPDGKELACGSSAGRVLLWEPATDRRRSVVYPHRVSCLLFRAAEHALAAGSSDGIVQLWDRSTAAQRTFLPPETMTATVPPNARLTAQLQFDRSFALLSLPELKPVLRAPPAPKPLTTFTITADGKKLAAGAVDGDVYLWDLTSEPLQGPAVLRGHTLGIRRLAFSADGSRLASISADASVRVWDVATARELGAVGGVASTAIVCSRDGKVVAAAGDDGSIRVWDTEEMKPLSHIPNSFNSVLALSGDGRVLAAALVNSGHVMLWDTATAEPRGKFGARASLLFFDREDRLLIANGGGRGTVVWDVAGGKEHCLIPLYISGWVAFTPDGKILHTGDGRGGSLQWDLTTGQECTPFRGHRLPIYALALTPDGKRLASGGGHDNGEGELKVWDVTTGREHPLQADVRQLIFSVAFSPDGKILAAGSHDGTTRLWDWRTGKELPGPPKAIGGINAVAFTPDGKTLAAGRRWFLDKTQTWALRDVQLWDLENNCELKVLTGHLNGVTRLAISPDGTRLASGTVSGQVKVWELPGGRELHTMQHRERFNAVAFSPDGKRLATGSSEPQGKQYPGVVTLWDTESGEEILSLRGPTRPISTVAFSPDGRLLAVAAHDGSLRLYDADSGAPRATLQLPANTMVWAIVFTPDGNRFITGDSTASIRFWEVAAFLKDHAPKAQP